MNKKMNTSQNMATGPCLCQLAGSALNELIHRLGPPEQARQHFENARIEMLKGVRALVDARIAQRSRSKSKGEKIAVD